MTLYYSEILAQELYFRISRQKNIQTRVRKWMNQESFKNVMKRYKHNIDIPRHHLDDEKAQIGKENTPRKLQSKRYGYGRSVVDKGRNILTRVLNKQMYGNGKSILKFRGRPNPVEARRNSDKDSSFTLRIDLIA